MTAAVVINANASAVTEMLLRSAMAQAYRQDHKNELGEWHMHPAQYAACCQLASITALSILTTHAPKDFVNEVKKQFEDYGPSTIMGLPIRQDAKVDHSIIELHYKDGSLVAIITNLAIPAAFSDVT